MPKLSTVNTSEAGRRIKVLREAEGLSRFELAKIIGVTESAIKSYEYGERGVRDEIKVRIATYFGKTVQEIFFDEQ